MRVLALLPFLIITVVTAGPVYAQTVNVLYDQVMTAFKSKDYDTNVDLCTRIITRCKSEVRDVECQFTDRMKNVYHFKGVAEFELSLVREEPNLLDDAIVSLQLSYNWYQDPDVSYKLGYIQSVRAIENGEGEDFVGMVNAWRGILGLYAANGWAVDADMIGKLKSFIGQAIDLSVVSADDHTTGRFTSMMVNLACDLAEKANLSSDEREFFKEYRQIATEDESNLRGNEWRARGFAAERAFKESPSGANYAIARDHFEKAYRYIRSPHKQAEILTELAKIALYMNRVSEDNSSEELLHYAHEKARQAYDLIKRGRLRIPEQDEDEIKTVYGTSVLNLVNYYYNLDTNASAENYLLARRTGEELLSRGRGGLDQMFAWDGYEQLYRQLSLVGYEMGDRSFAVEMADKAWKTALATKGLDETGPCSASSDDAPELLRYAENYTAVADRFGLQPMKVWIRPFLDCLREKSGL